jgi:hypothetical protein
MNLTILTGTTSVHIIVNCFRYCQIRFMDNIAFENLNENSYMKVFNNYIF